MALPGSSFKIVDVKTFKELASNEEGMILIAGIQVMKGYLKDINKTKSVIREINSTKWYITGDKGKIDEDGFLTVVDRYSRFAKIGGEMVSLGLVEEKIREVLDDDNQISISAIPDEKKGEKLVLLFQGELELETLRQSIKDIDLSLLFIPSEYYKVNNLPVLGTGKTDYNGTKNLAIELSNKSNI
jgi:acyl-[acyl-carrier-protein]-phospholipid O-acyltransferase/long-chain-fatty-acid--[acyl-carrier-protein] ligase